MSRALAHKKKPQWKDAPVWANYLAMDDCDEWCWYEREPSQVPILKKWTTTGRCENARPHYADKWNNSMEPRPTEVQS